MCLRPITYEHRCEGYRILFTDKRQHCTYCKRSCSSLLEVRRASPRRAPSSGWGGLTGQLVDAPRGSQGPR